MRVLVTGAGGFLGRHVLQVLAQSAIPMFAVGRTRPENLAPESFIAADLLATADLRALVRSADATHLLHLAWVTEHGKYWDSPLNFRWVDASTRLVEAFCESGGHHVVVAGTCAEYDWHRGHCREDETPLVPATVYGVAKDATRRLVMALCAQHRVSCAWGRIFFPYGAGEAPQRLLPSLVAALQGRSGNFGVSGSAARDFLHAGDAARGLMALVSAGANGSFNISSGEPVTIEELVRTLARLLDKDPQPLLDLPPQRPSDTALLVGDSGKLCKLGWRPELTLVQGLQHTLRQLAAMPI